MSIPVIAAGGISSSSDIRRYLSKGVSAVQMGTVFLATKESGASDEHKELLLSKEALETELTTVYTGRLARTLSKPWHSLFKSDKMRRQLAPYPIQSAFMSGLRKASLARNQTEYVAHWSGQPSRPLVHRSAKELLNALVAELDADLERTSAGV